MFTPDKITVLAPHEIFVFSSNFAGHHGAGVALWAAEHFGAEEGVGEGPTGQCYAIPTKGWRLDVKSLPSIYRSIMSFKDYAWTHPQLIFLVTPIGCGLAGYTPSQIAPMFIGAPVNVILPMSFHAAVINTLSKP